MSVDEMDLCRVAKTVKKDSWILFCGAGVSCQAGLPTWKSALLQMAGHVQDNYNQNLADAMKGFVKSGDYLRAADCLSIAIPKKSNRISLYEDIFSGGEQSEDIEALLTLSPAAIFTTNYDHQIEKHWENIGGSRLPSYSNTKHDLKFALRKLTTKSPFVCHIHGSLDRPARIALAGREYEKLYSSEELVTLLKRIALQYPIIFVGYSLSDPDLEQIIGRARDKYELACANESFVLAPKSDRSVAQKASKFSLTPVYYDTHDELWNAIRDIGTIDVASDFGENDDDEKGTSSEEISRVRSILSAAYAHYRVQESHQTVSSSVYSGVVQSIVQDRTSNGQIRKKDLIDAVQGLLECDTSKAQEVTELGVKELRLTNQVDIADGLYQFSGCDDRINPDIEELVREIRRRARVRYGRELALSSEAIRELLVKVLVVDGVSLAHAYIARGNPSESRMGDAVDNAVDELGLEITAERKVLKKAISSLFSSPSAKEAEILGRISRLAFVSDIVLSLPRDLPGRSGEPDRVYLDTNVVLPALVGGHPKTAYFRNVLKTLSARNIEVAFDTCFVEELVNHRREGERIIKGYSSYEDLLNLAIYDFIHNSNAFVSGFLSWMEVNNMKRNSYPYEEYFEDTAPYATRNGMTETLKEMGIDVVDTKGDLRLEQARVVRWENALDDAYSGKEHYSSSKHPALIKHEARLLEGVAKAAEMGKDYWIVTEDKGYLNGTLAACDRDDLFPDIALKIFRPLQLDVRLDAEEHTSIEWRSYAHTLWSGAFKELVEPTVERYIDKILQEYEPRLVERIPDIMNRLERKIRKRDSIERLSHIDETDTEEYKRVFTVLEDEFYEIMDDILQEDQKS